jgi:hypothetical protein
MQIAVAVALVSYLDKSSRFPLWALLHSEETHGSQGTSSFQHDNALTATLSFILARNGKHALIVPVWCFVS